MKAHCLSIETSPFGSAVLLHPTLIECNGELILVDCGYRGSLAAIEAQLSFHKFAITDLTTVIITHDDLDHIGGLFELQSANPNLRVMASGVETPYVEGKLKSLRLVQAEQVMDKLPGEMINWAMAFQRELRAVKRVPVDSVLSETICDGSIEVIDTPGHTPGHISLYIPSTKTMIAGDALVAERGKLEIANPQFTLDIDRTVESVRKLVDFEIDELYCYHGGVISNCVNKKIIELADRYTRH